MKENSKKLFGLLLSLTMLFSILPAASVAGYSDTANHWAETAIGRWSDYGVVEGYGNAFNPDNAITRAQMATILSKTLGLTQTAENPFEDVSEDSWYASYILQCYKAGIMLGSDGKANPDDEITRQEAMTMFCRAFNINAVTDADLSVYSDESEIADWAFPYVSALINRGIVSGVTSDTVAPKETMSRASLVTILDRAVVQYIQTSGEYELAEEDGIILVAAGDVTLTGKTASDIMITEAADGKELTFKDAVVTGNVTVKADAKIINDNSTLPEIDATVENKKQTPKRTGGSSGGSRPSVSNLTIDEEKTVSSATYNNVTITDAVGDGEVTIENVTVKGDLTINGGGSNSVKLINCTIKGKVIMAKETGERPRLELTNTPVTAVDVQKPAIIEAADNASAVSKIEATANIEIKGENTKVSTVTIPETAQETVNVTVTAGNVATVEAKAETTVAGAADSVNTIVATAAVTADSSAVQKVEIPETATESVSVTVTGTDAVDVEVNAASGVAVTGENVTVSTTLETVPENITVGGGAVTHIHKWGVPETTEPTCQESGQRVYTCIAEGCEDTAITKTEVIPALGHNYGEWKLSDDDLHVRECANNKNHYDKADHTWDEGKVTTEANCGKEGVKTYTCPICKGTRTETIEKPAHNWGDWVKVDADTHKRICKNDRKHIETEDHTPIIDEAVPATCTETGKTEGSHCDICNSVIVEQTTTPALKHDFTGEYEKDADGHWHICGHDNCEETDKKANHTYNTKNCEEIATCTVCGYKKPAGEHSWGKWEKVDDTNHKRTCTCETSETEEHKWDDGEITTDPTETKEGVKTYTCSECKGRKTEAVPVLPEEEKPTSIYTFGEEKGLRIKWTEATLSEGQSYYVTIKEPSSQYSCTSASFPVGGFTSKDNIVSGKISIKVDVGTDWKETSALYEEKEIADITITDTVPTFTIEKDDNGAYNFVSDATGGLWVYQVYNNDGLLTYNGNAIDGAIDSYANFADGQKVVARYMTWTLSDNKDYAEITLTQQAEYTYSEKSSLLLFRKWNTDIMFDGYDDVLDTKHLEISGDKVVSSQRETMSEFLFDYDQTKGNIIDADFVVELDGVEKERISKNVDVTLSNTDVAFTINADGTLSFDATTHGSFAYKTTKDGQTAQSGRIAFNNGTLVDGWVLPTLTDGETIDIMHIDCDYEENSKTISATISKHTSKTYTASTTKEIWFSEDGDGIYVEWKEAELADGERYFITIKEPESLFNRTKAKLDLGTFFDEDQMVNGKLLMKVDKGATQAQTQTLYEEKEIANVTLTNTTPDFTIDKDSTGKYKFVSDLSGGAWVYTTYDGNGNLMYVGNVVDGAIDTYANFADGHTVKARYITWSLNDDKTYAEFSVSNIATYTYNEPVASDTNAHLMMDGDYLYLVFEDEEGLGANEWYYVLQNGENITSEDLKEIELTWLLPGISENTVLNYEIQKGNWQTKETFVKLDNAINITVTDSAPNLSLAPQADGAYKITGGGDTGYFYRVTAPDGERLATDYTLDDTFLCAIYEGCTVELQTGIIAVAEDGLSANITMSPVVKIENPTLPTGLNTVVEVDTADELLDAVNRGAIATLTTDITSENAFKFKTGAPATINLNGHTLTAPNTRTYYGKELVIDATEEGSAIIGNVTVQLYGKLTLNGGAYSKIRVTDGRSFVADGITVESTDSSYALEIGYSDYVEINNSSCINTSNSDSGTGLYIWRSDDIILNNTTAISESNSFGADIAWCTTVNITGGSFSAENSQGLRFVECENATIDGASVSGSTGALLVQDGAVVEINGGTFTSANNTAIQLSREDSALTINDGTFTANGDGSVKNIVIMEDANSFVINGGTFAEFTGVTYSETANAIINGGTFSFDPTNYVDAATRTVTDNEDGTFTVAEKTE